MNIPNALVIAIALEPTQLTLLSFQDTTHASVTSASHTLPVIAHQAHTVHDHALGFVVPGDNVRIAFHQIDSKGLARGNYKLGIA